MPKSAVGKTEKLFRLKPWIIAVAFGIKDDDANLPPYPSQVRLFRSSPWKVCRSNPERIEHTQKKQGYPKD